MASHSVRRTALVGCIAAAAVGISGCSQDLDYKGPVFPFKKSYVSARAGTPVLLSNANWWTSFKDPTLNALIERALAGNLDIAAARERVVEARADIGLVPENIALTAEPSIKRTDTNTRAPRTETEAALGLGWMLDPYGSRKRKLQAARARLEVADAEVDAARLLLIYNLSNAYVDLRYNQRALELRRQQLRSRRRALNLTRELFDQKSATRLDVIRTEALVNETQSQIPALTAAVRRSKYQIAVLTGALPGSLDIDLDKGRAQPTPTVAPDVGIPSDLLRNRPDIRIAERLYYASVAEIDVAKAQLYPQLSLGGTISIGSVDGTSTNGYSFGPSVTFPSPFSDDEEAGVTAAESRARQAYTDWTKTVLDAVLDVESALVDYSGNASAVSSARRTAQLYRESVSLTRDLILREGATVLDLVDAEQSAAAADIAHVALLRDMARSYIELNVGLGSGHRVGDEPPTESGS